MNSSNPVTLFKLLRWEQLGESANITVLGCVIMILGIMLSRFMISLGMIILVANAVLTTDYKKNLKSFVRNKVLLVISSLFLIYVLSGLYSENLEYYFRQLRIKLPFLLLAFAFAGVKGLSTRRYYFILYFFILNISFFSLRSTIYYLNDYREITNSYSAAQVLPTIIHHVRFSLMVTFAIICGGYLYYKKYFLFYRWERYLILVCTLFLLAFLHILSVRSGMLTFYVVLLYISVRYFYLAGKYFPGIALIGLILCMPIVAYYTVQTFENKINYSLYDLGIYLKGSDPTRHSDSRRIISIKMGWDAASGSPLIGVGAGDIKDKVDEEYANHYPGLPVGERLLPHNQFVYVYTGIGLIGLLCFLFIFIYPVIYKRNYRDYLFVSFNLIIFISFLVEHTIETQIGTAFYLLFLLLGLSDLQNRTTLANA